ncbi:uncharacterized protein LOC120432630 [Culex pipiens pallens]|uniref:uncharacterized protein LOC120432630 n=1 Tax=Culex pipiens pallens TaxID=42434 RepID=UPI001954A208|nr:uncharacterized protein LOC120432630 [Culex pipiens pallens]
MDVRGLVVMLALCAGSILAESEPAEQSSVERMEFMQEIKDECRNNTGDDRAFQDLLVVLNQDTPKCFMQHVNLSYLQAPITNLNKQEQTTLMTQICGQVEKSLTCINPVVDKVKRCMTDDDDLKILRKLADTVPEALKMICNDSGAMLLKLREPLARSCAIELAPTIDVCMDGMSNSTMEMTLSRYTITECNEVYKMRDCIINRIRDCGANTYLELFNLFYRSLLSLTPCK